MSASACLLRAIACSTVVLTLFCSAGCVNSLRNTIPAQKLSPEHLHPFRDDLVPIDFTLLGQSTCQSHVIGPGDILGIYIQGVLGRNQGIEFETHFPMKFGDADTGSFLLPPKDDSESRDFSKPAVGAPITVEVDGTIALPFVPGIKVAHLRLADAAAKIRDVYAGMKLLQPEGEVVNVTLIKSRSVQVLVLREDSVMLWPILKLNNQTLAVKRGSGQVIDLPVCQNDVLHALTVTGGLPGSDARDEVWVLHGADKTQWNQISEELSKARERVDMDQAIPSSLASRIVKIRLKTQPGEEVGVAAEEMVLESGDVVFIPARDRENFFVGGLLTGQQVYLPRDYDLDVISAIAMAGGSPAGPGQSLFSSRSPGAILPPTRILIQRKVAGGDKILIHVDLRKALHDRRERIPIRAGDTILLQFTPMQVVGNYLLNLFNFSVTISRDFTNVPAQLPTLVNP